jgi:hypothetical protein
MSDNKQPLVPTSTPHPSPFSPRSGEKEARPEFCSKPPLLTPSGRVPARWMAVGGEDEC